MKRVIYSILIIVMVLLLAIGNTVFANGNNSQVNLDRGSFGFK